MYIAVDTTRASAEVREAADLKHLSVRPSGPSDAESVSRGLGELGRIDASGNAWIDISALRRASGRPDDAAWSSGFDAMIAYAASQGWVDDDGVHVRAHVESADPGR